MKLGKAVLYGKEKTVSVSAQASEKELNNGVKAVYVNGKADFCLDATEGCIYKFDRFDNIKAWSAVSRRCPWWCAPQFGENLSELLDETQLLMLEHTTGKYTVILPVISDVYRCVLKGDSEDNGLIAKIYTQCDNIYECNAPAFVYAECDNPHKIIKTLYREALKEVGSEIKLCEERNYPDILEYLGWCSWDAMQIRVNEEGLLEKCKEFKEKNIPVRWAIIDDMWADIPSFLTGTYSNFGEMVALMHSSPMAAFEGAPQRFPKGMKHTIEKMKKYISWVGLWYPITGYWSGLIEGEEAANDLKGHLGVSSSGKLLAIPEYQHFKAYFDYFNGKAKDFGADFVKIDNQGGANEHYKGMRPINSIASEMHAAIEESVETNFDNCLINCMGCSSTNSWNRKATAISRCSGDFQPENAEWFIQHILQCSFVSFMQGPLIYCDWDMWWTDDGQAAKNSLIRAISGGPIYVSDQIGRSKRELLMPLCLDDGRILRCNRPATPTLDCLITNPETNGKIFKIQNMCATSGVIAAFNLDSGNKPVKGTISPADIEGLDGEEFAVYENFTHKFYTMKKDDTMEVEFADRDDYRLYIFTPIADGFAAIGRTDKYMSPLTVKRIVDRKVELYEKGDYAYYDNGMFYEVSKEGAVIANDNI